MIGIDRGGWFLVFVCGGRGEDFGVVGEME
jgi:hypothetical protein